jgi:hypothetical protein
VASYRIEASYIVISAALAYHKHAGTIEAKRSRDSLDKLCHILYGGVDVLSVLIAPLCSIPFKIYDWSVDLSRTNCVHCSSSAT